MTHPTSSETTFNDEKLDALIEAVAAGEEYIERDIQDAFGGYRKSEVSRMVIGAYHGSLDAAKALHEALLPGYSWYLGHLDEPMLGYCATVSHGHFADSPSWRGFSADPARAWLLAILKAYRTQVTK